MRNAILVSHWLLVSLWFPVVAAEPTPPEFRDIQVAHNARRILHEDPVLAGLNLGVIVRRGEANVWAVVPSHEVGEKALQMVEKVRGVYGVRSELQVAGKAVETALRDIVAGALHGAGRSDALLPSEPAESGSGLPERLTLPPGTERPRQVVLARPMMPSWEEPAPRPRPLSAAVTLMPPVPLPGLVVPTARTVEDAYVEPHSAAESVRQSDPRWREVRIEFSDGRLTLSGRVSSAENLIDLGRALNRLAGVKYVDLRGVQVVR